MNKKIIILALMLMMLCFSITANANIKPTNENNMRDSNGWKFKEIIWDAGWIWVLMLVMGLATIFDLIRGIIADSKAARGEPDEIRRKPSYEILVRRRLE